ncbi:hypothetical protein Q8A73_016620 [Channa argus]|nr:hypothetical protein Q8A73_016620 [Channa argus]
MTSLTPWTGALSNERGRQSGERPLVLLELRWDYQQGVQGDDTAKSGGYESRQNPLPSSSAQARIRLTTIGSEPPPKQLSDEPSIGWFHNSTQPPWDIVSLQPAV